MVITDAEHYFHVAWGLRVAAASSSVLEWSTKFLALHLVLTVGFKGHIFFFCDNASTLFCGMTQWMKLSGGPDRFVKLVLGKVNLCTITSFGWRLNMTRIIQAWRLPGGGGRARSLYATPPSPPPPPPPRVLKDSGAGSATNKCL